MNWKPWKDKRSKRTAWPVDECRHWRTEVKIGGFTVLASGLMDRPKDGIPGPEPWPDAGIYLDRSWFSHLGGIASAGVDAPIDPWWPFIVVDWPDQGALEADYYAALVDSVVEMLEAGKRVEVACQGGHGRTGTLLAGVLARVESLPAAEAIKSLRDRYCEEAVESRAQVRQVHEYLGEEPPAALAPPKTTPSTWDMDACVCRHVRRNHADKSGSCRKCGCPSFKLGAVAGEELV
jgi:hypothetical protein